MGSDDRRDGGHQRDLFTTRGGQERRRVRGDELRYEGPLIVGDDSEEADDQSEAETSGSGRAFFTAAIVGGIVILLVGAALWFRSSTDEMISAEENARLAAATDASTIAAEPAQSERDDVPPPLPPPSTPESADVFRPVPEAPTTRSGSAPHVAEATPPSLREEPAAPEPVPAAAARPAPSEASLRRDDGGHPSVRALVEAGRLDEAAMAGQRAARVSPWSLQVLLACDPANVRRAFENVPSGSLSVVPARVGGRACWRILYGSYPDRAGALAGIDSVPDYFRQSGKPTPYETR